jgi:hypothetical protein
MSAFESKRASGSLQPQPGRDAQAEKINNGCKFIREAFVSRAQELHRAGDENAAKHISQILSDLEAEVRRSVAKAGICLPDKG